jgi:hypothetical protein
MFNIGLFLVFVHLVPYTIQNNIYRTATARAVGLIYDHVGHYPPGFHDRRFDIHDSWSHCLFINSTDK